MRRTIFPLALLVLIAMTGCASAPSAVGSASAPTAACPQQPGVELPAGCAGYDPDAAMAANESYRQRIDLAPDVRAAADELVPDARSALETTRGSGTLTADAVRSALEDVGLRDVQTRSAGTNVLFGAAAPQGGCLYGSLSAETVIVDAGGYIRDGGCLPAQ